MEPPRDFIPVRRTLLRFDGVVVALPAGGRIGPISWTLERGRRIAVRCADEAQWEAFVDLLTGKRRAQAGQMEELRTVRVQTDTNLRQFVNSNKTMQEFLESPDAPASVWMEGRRRSLRVLVDALGISPAMTRRVLKLHGEAVQDKYWALRFMLSQADLVIGRNVFRLADAEVQSTLRRRWGDIPGALIIGETGGELPGAIDARVHIAPDGCCTVETFARVPAGASLPSEDA